MFIYIYIYICLFIYIYIYVYSIYNVSSERGTYKTNLILKLHNYLRIHKDSNI